MGSFCRAVISNDLFEALGRADTQNAQALPAIASFVYNEFPMATRDYRGWIDLHAARKLQEAQS